MKTRLLVLTGAVALGLLGLDTRSAVAGPIDFTFAPGQYDNTANTVSAGGALHVNQTSGNWRDVFWFSTRNPVGPNHAQVGGADFINSGKNLISSGGSPAHAVPGGLYDALNFTGDATSAGQSYLSVYDTTPTDKTTTENLFSGVGGLTVSADVLFTPGQHSACGGVVALYLEGYDGLALQACNGGGNNQDVPKLSLIFQAAGMPTTLASVNLSGSSLDDDMWYRVTMTVTVVGDTWNVAGSFNNHVIGADPTSGLGNLITALNFSGSVSNPNDAGLHLHNPGEVGVIVSTPEGFSDGGCPPPFERTNGNHCNDNVGVSVTNFHAGDPVPEPGSMLLLGSGLLGLGRLYKRKRS